MKYAKIENDQLLVKEVEKGMEVDGKLTEEEIIAQGYKPLCEVEKQDGAEGFVYKDYGTCYVQIWKMPGEEIHPDEIWTADSGIMPKFSDLRRLQRDITMVNTNINSMNLTNNESLAVKKLFPVWKEDLGEVKQGEKYQLNDKLYKVVQDHTTQANWSPEKQSSLWEEVVEDHEGTLEDPIPYNEAMNPQWQGMVLEEGKYYTQGGVIYKCIRNTGNKVTQILADLVSGGFVEQVK